MTNKMAAIIQNPSSVDFYVRNIFSIAKTKTKTKKT